jgi:hypothetical protein
MRVVTVIKPPVNCPYTVIVSPAISLKCKSARTPGEIVSSMGMDGKQVKKKNENGKQAYTY